MLVRDIMMPAIDGVEVCRDLKADARTRDALVIFLTARGTTRDEAVGLLKRKRLENHRVNDAEDSRRGAEPQRQREDRDQRDQRTTAKRAGGVPEILEHGPAVTTQVP